MPTKALSTSERRMLRKAVSRWENEGGLVASLSDEYPEMTTAPSTEPPLTNTELEHLRARVVALESVVVTLLATASKGQIALAREIAAFILPRPGSTQHPLTKDACIQIVNLAERAEQLRR